MQGTLKQLWCTGQKDFEEWAASGLPGGWAVISIIGTEPVLTQYLKEPETTHALPDSEWVLNLEFDDITSDTLEYHGITATGISREQAEAIVRFLDRAVKEGKNIYVHCRAGRSRSQAIVRYVKSRFPGPWLTNPFNPDDTPNYHVLSKLREIAYEEEQKSDNLDNP